ncbi:hypothetical protein Poly30_38170 [Planctomycetes bacterium Poly30]|uniref:Uncharacterized protein n=1 Tax=Saltatorellus ferox TaxID=2528018 RepID=A0A518EW17_9BACT|nr:hypothetical protein Poly30_38170 [Planctomycetes bacterium Poly30]
MHTRFARVRSCTLTLLQGKRRLTEGFLALATATAGAAQCGYTEILPQPGFEDSAARAISSDGATVVGASFGPSGARAFRWTEATGLQPLQASGSSEALGVSADGTVVAGYWSNGLMGRAFHWTAATGAVDLVTPGATFADARAVSDDGTVLVGRMRIGGQDRAFRWTAAGGALDISENGVIVGYRTIDPLNGSSRAFVWRSSTIGTTYCDTAVANGTGCIGRLDVNGKASVAANALRLDASSLPANVFGFFLAARATGSTPAAGGGAGPPARRVAVGRGLTYRHATPSGPGNEPVALSSAATSGARRGTGPARSRRSTVRS